MKKKGLSKDDPFHTGDKLRQLRVRDKYPLEHVAAELGVGRSTLSDYERGVVFPPREVLEKAAALFKVDTGIFYNTDHLSFNIHGNQQANGYVQEQHNVDKDLVDRFFAHINERDKRIEDLLAKAIEKLGKK